MSELNFEPEPRDQEPHQAQSYEAGPHGVGPHGVGPHGVGPHEAAGSEEAGPGQLADPEDGWQKLSLRDLFVDPINTIRGAIIPLLFAAVGLGSQDLRLLLLTPVIVVMIIVAGLVPYLTTRYRVTDTQFQLRKGLLSKTTSTAPLDRIRSVDLEASLLHRLFGVTKVEIGTGVDDERLILDSLDKPVAEALRRQLLAHRIATPTSAGLDPRDDSNLDPSTGFVPAPAPVELPEEVIATLSPTWVRFAPFSLARMVVVAGAIGVLAQFADDLPFLSAENAESALDWVTQFAILVILAVTFFGALLGWVLIAVAGYVTQWWNFRLTRQHDSLHLTHGLFTTHSVSVEEPRIRGVQLDETVLIRLVRGADLSTLSTGMSSGTTQIMPPCPRSVATDVGGRVLGDAEPLRVALAEHGPRALRRSLLRGLWPAWFLLAVTAVLTIGLPGEAGRFVEENIDLRWLLVSSAAVGVIGVLCGWAAYRHLGHHLTARHLVAGSGILTRRRSVLETDGIIGWVVRQSFWQRRQGLATLVATTAAGSESVQVRDVRHDLALQVAHAATPEMFAPFLLAPERL